MRRFVKVMLFLKVISSPEYNSIFEVTRINTRARLLIKDLSMLCLLSLEKRRKLPPKGQSYNTTETRGVREIIPGLLRKWGQSPDTKFPGNLLTTLSVFQAKQNE